MTLSSIPNLLKAICVSTMGSAMGSVIVAQLLMNQITIKLRRAAPRVTRVRKREAVIDFYRYMYIASLACFYVDHATRNHPLW